MAKRRSQTPRRMLHLELWVARRKDRPRIRRLLRSLYAVARPITRIAGGDGPWVFLIAPDAPRTRTTRLRATLGVKRDEDLWLELAFYPNRARMGAIIRRIWADATFAGKAAALDALVSRRRPGYEATLAYGILTVA